MNIVYMLPLEKNDILRLKDSQTVPEDIVPDSFLLTVVPEYLKLGHSVRIITLSDEESFEVHTDRFSLINIKKFRHGNLSVLSSYLRETRAIRRKLEEIEYDVLHAHWCYEYACAALSADPERTVISLHDWPHIINEYVSSFFWKMRVRVGGRCLQRGKHFIAVSPYIRDLFTGMFPDKKIAVAQNFLADSQFCNSGKLSDFSERTLKVIAVSNSSLRKNINATLQAFRILRSRLGSVELSLYGAGLGENGPSMQWARENDCMDGVRFLGKRPREEVCAAIKDADLLLHTSKEESFGMILLEAMAVHTAVLAGKGAGGPDWVLENGRSGILADITDPADVADKAMAILTDHDARARLTEHAYEYARSHFAASAVCPLFLQEYEKVVNASD